jgi:hypothetical protein
LLQASFKLRKKAWSESRHFTELNKRQPRPMPADYKRPDSSATAANWKGQSSYAGKDKRPASAARTPQERIAEAQPGYSRPVSKDKGSAKAPPKVQGSYAGKDTGSRPTPSAKPAQKPKPVQKPQTRDLPKSPPKAVPAGDRGYGTRDVQRPSSKPSAQPAPTKRPSPGMQQGGNKGSAMSGASGKKGSASAASQRGKQSMPQGARSKGSSGGKKQAR